MQVLKLMQLHAWQCDKLVILRNFHHFTQVHEPWNKIVHPHIVADYQSICHRSAMVSIYVAYVLVMALYLRTDCVFQQQVYKFYSSFAAEFIRVLRKQTF